MIATEKECVAFRDYLAGLRSLEEAFQSAGEKIEFRLKLHEGKDRYVEILHNGKLTGLKFIEGDSPALAVKEVGGEVPL
jgi:hypothetical protein